MQLCPSHIQSVLLCNLKSKLYRKDEPDCGRRVPQLIYSPGSLRTLEGRAREEEEVAFAVILLGFPFPEAFLSGVQTTIIGEERWHV